MPRPISASGTHIAKFAADIAETAKEEYHLTPTVIDLKSCSDAQNAPTPYAIFALIYNGRLLADHQISRTRFRNVSASLARATRGVPRHSPVSWPKAGA